jgi:hypothetical protein
MTDWPCTFAKKEMIDSTAIVTNAQTDCALRGFGIGRKSSVR